MCNTGDLLHLMSSDTDFNNAIKVAEQKVSETGFMSNADEFLLKHKVLLSLAPLKRKEIIDELSKPMSLFELHKKLGFNHEDK